MPAFPTQGGSNNTWGSELDAALAVVHNMLTGALNGGIATGGALGADVLVTGTAIQDKTGVMRGPMIDTKGPFKNFKDIFGQPLQRGHIPHAAQLTKNAIAGLYNWPVTVATLPEATTSLATQLSGITAGTQKRILPATYREAVPSITVDGVRLYGYGDVALTTFDRWDIGANTWATAASPNNANGSFVSSLTVPTFTVDADSPPIIAGGINTTLALPEQVMLDGVMYNRVVAGSTLALGQWMLDGSRHVVVRPGNGVITNHEIEVSMRQNICTPGAGGTNLILDGMYIYGGPSGADSGEPLQQNNQAGFTVRNCMIGFTHGLAIAGGGAVGFKAVDNVFHNCGTIGIDSGSSGSLVAGNVAFNCGGTQNTYSNALDSTGYDWTWGSGFCKLSCDYGVQRDNIAFNLGFASYWQDVLCRYGTVINNVCWDTRSANVQIEVSSYFKVYGNHVFQTSATQFSGTASTGVFISSSRDGEVGADINAGQEPNVVMRIGVAYKLGWQTTRGDLPVGDGSTQGNNAASGKFLRVILHDNVAVLRKTGGQGPGGPDLAIYWNDLAGSGQACISDASNSGAHMLVGFENATPVVTGMTWPDDYIFLSDVTGLTGQVAGGWFMNVGLWNAIRWDAWADPSNSQVRKSRYLTYAEQAHYLNMYGLSQVS